jgi:hypothetical protein
VVKGVEPGVGFSTGYVMRHTHENGFMCRILDCPDRRPECTHEDGRFISQESFVGFAAGTETPMDGTVVCCSLCERNGVVRRVDDAGFIVVHVQTTEVFADGARSDPDEFCRVPEPSSPSR